MAEVKGEALYPMAIVREKTGLSDRQIRYYEKRGLVKPARSKGNQRLFTGEDIIRLVEIKRYLQRGYTTADIGALLKPRATVPPRPNVPRRIDPRLKSLYPVSSYPSLLETLESLREDEEGGTLRE